MQVSSSPCTDGRAQLLQHNKRRSQWIIDYLSALLITPLEGISDSQGPLQRLMLLQTPFEPGQKYKKKKPKKPSQGTLLPFQSRVLPPPFSPVPFLINLSSIKKTDSKKNKNQRKYRCVAVTVVKRGEESDCTGLGSRVPSGCGNNCICI